MRPVTLQDYKRRVLRVLRSRPCFEVYLNDPNSTDPADLLTDLYAPLERKSATPKARRSPHPT